LKFLNANRFISAWSMLCQYSIGPIDCPVTGATATSASTSLSRSCSLGVVLPASLARHGQWTGEFGTTPTVPTTTHDVVATVVCMVSSSISRRRRDVTTTAISSTRFSGSALATNATVISAYPATCMAWGSGTSSPETTISKTARRMQQTQSAYIARRPFLIFFYRCVLMCDFPKCALLKIKTI